MNASTLRRFRTRLPGALLGLSFLILGLAPAAEAAASPQKLELGACDQPGLPPDARCGTYEVWEDRAAQAGRKIPLRVVVLPATGKPEEKLPDAFTYFAGGPGDSSVNGAGWMAESMKGLRQRRDILVVDFRGTGASAGLFCEELQGKDGIQGFLDDFLPAEGVKRCAERLAKTRDLAQYTSANTIDDIDEVRAALGYEKLNLLGGSAGTRLALVYLRRHPERVRTATLLGAVPTDELGPFSMARSAQDALDGVVAECQRDAGCRAAFPELKKEVAEVFRRVEREPVVVRLTDAATGEPVEVRLSKTGLAQTVRYMLYSSSSAFQIPLYVHLAAKGDWKLLAEAARLYGGNMTSLADGYYLALTCAEDLPFIPEKEVPAAVAGTFLGDFRIRKQQAACAAWPATPVSRDFLEPVVSDVPVLLISGGLDPVTPASNAEHVARTLKNSRHLVVEQGGHSYDGYQGIECIDEVIVDFVQAGKLEGLDTSCMAGLKRPEFALSVEPEIALKAADLEPLTGTYKDLEIGFAVKVELAGDRLRAIPDGQPPVLLAPTSPTRFRLEGMPPGLAVVFQRAEGGKATAILFERPGAEARTLVRQEE